MHRILHSKQSSQLYNLLLVVGGALLIVLAAQIAVPLVPVPITLQSTAVLFIGMIYGWRLGVCAILLYLIAGLCGLPVFADFSCGPSVLLGPTSGYLLGFIPAAIVSGYLMQHGWAKSSLKAFAAGFVGTLPIFILGVMVLANFIGWHNAYIYGVQVFFGIELAKVVLLAIITPKFWK